MSFLISLIYLGVNKLRLPSSRAAEQRSKRTTNERHWALEAGKQLTTNIIIINNQINLRNPVFPAENRRSKAVHIIRRTMDKYPSFDHLVRILPVSS